MTHEGEEMRERKEKKKDCLGFTRMFTVGLKFFEEILFCFVFPLV